MKVPKLVKSAQSKIKEVKYSDAGKEFIENNRKKFHKQIEKSKQVIINISNERKNTTSTRNEANTSNTTIDKRGAYGIDVGNLANGFVIDERYKVMSKLGTGGFGTVYKVWDNSLGAVKALKVIHSDFYNDKEAIEKLKQEAKLLYKLEHPNIVKFHDIHLRGEIKYLDMELISGGDLNDLKRKHKAVPEDVMLPIIKQITSGMIKIHEAGIIHKDLKPANIMLTDNGAVKIMDFGISETIDNSQTRLSETSRSGTAVYQSPEHLNGKLVGKESDIWSFGVLCYEMLSGKPVFRGDTWDDVKSCIKGRLEVERANGCIIQFKKIEGLPNVSYDLNTIMKRCLRWDYTERFNNYEEVHDSLNRITTYPNAFKKRESIYK